MARPKSDNPLTPAERSIRYRQAVKDQGGRQLCAMQLDASDARKLASLKRERSVSTDADMVRTLIREA